MDQIADFLPLVVVLGLVAFAINAIAQKAGADRVWYVVGLVVGGGLGAVMGVQRDIPWSWGLGIGIGASVVMAEVAVLVKARLGAKKE